MTTTEPKSIGRVIPDRLTSPLTRARLHAELLDDGAQRDALLKLLS